ncbi:T9SS type B sorting domain-containing protein [Frigoriflavimonas asaccharolytica]|uniref:Gliding motility-associated-like protein n=1 Tax=Frigoriflavimonas asaccharolytica TaxID=2735899 RepID=A0A8J8GAX1_9FLAO|nr:T9SS type B sorting domain-containing protein [Frigoriflavimonas asaccharolytica]NRS93860.1 gliding motility-associated-like protein [Frigoriflavimonas asaccharolytica]
MLKKLLLLCIVLFFNSYNAQEDCITAISLCGNSAINYTPSGVGIVNEAVGGCLSGEHNSVWYKFTIATSGTLTFDLTPYQPIDYDWAIYGPNKTCGQLGNPIRCNASGYYLPTGMNLTNTNTSSAGGNTDPYCKYMDVLAGETYYLYLDNWDATVYTFNLVWGGTATFVSAFNNTSLSPFPFIAPGISSSNPNSPNEINICATSSTFNLNTLTSGIINGNPNFQVHYYQNSSDAAAGLNPILTPISPNTSNTYYYSINYQDPTNPNNPANFCKQSGSFVFVQNLISSIITANSTVLCPNSSLTLSSSNATGNLWSTGQTTQSISVTTAGTYTLTNTNGFCTNPTATYSITDAPNPNLQISGNLVLCTNPTILTATSAGTGNTYVWSNGSTSNTTTVSTAGNYTVTVNLPNGCSFQKTAIVTQGLVPVVQNTSLNQCSTGTTSIFNLVSAQNNISTTLGATFNYYQNLADATSGNTNTISNPTAFSSGNAIIYVLVSVGNCTKIAQLQLIVNPPPVPVISASNMTICDGNPVSLSSNFSTGNLWSTGQTTQTITVNTAGIYTLTNTAGNCTSASANISITATPNPTIQITGMLNFCQGSSTTLIATSSGIGNTYVWSNGTIGANNIVTTGGLHTVTVTTGSGCTFTKTVTVMMDPTIIVNIATPAELNCTNTQVTLNASNSTFQPGSTIVWTASAGGNIVSGANTLSPIINSAGLYTCTITSTLANGCSNQASVNVINNSNPPLITITANMLTICNGESVILTASGAQTYTWTALNGNGNTQTVSPTSTTTYSVTGIGVNGCNAVNTATITIIVIPKIVSGLMSGQICKGDALILDAGIGSNYTYLWNTGATTQTISVTDDGSYNVTISNGACSKVFTATVSYKPVPEIENVTYSNATLAIFATNPTNQTLEYSIDGGLTWQDSNIFNNVKGNSGLDIFVRIKGEKCYSTINYFSFTMQNIITPNSDGYNDVVDFSNIINFKNVSAEIYDRYGKIVFKATKKNPIWDGTYNSRKLPTTSYWYIIKWTDAYKNTPIELTGWILLKNRD